MKLQKITPFLWFEKDAEAAAHFYTSVFKNSKIISSNPMVTTVELEGLNIMILNGGPMFKLNESFSLSVSCETQDEIDYYWEKLTEGGEESMCGWLKDRYGVSWQIIPAVLGSLLSEPARAVRVTQAFMKMKKMDIHLLEEA